MTADRAAGTDQSAGAGAGVVNGYSASGLEESRRLEDVGTGFAPADFDALWSQATGGAAASCEGS